MKNEIPEIEDLLQGIQGQVIGKTTPLDSTDVPVTEIVPEPEVDLKVSDDEFWNKFIEKLNNPDTELDKESRLVCKIDRDLADSLDDCDIGNKCRSDIVNAIIRAFFSTYMCRLVPFRREKKSLFKNFTQRNDESSQMDSGKA